MQYLSNEKTLLRPGMRYANPYASGMRIIEITTTRPYRQIVWFLTVMGPK